MILRETGRQWAVQGKQPPAGGCKDRDFETETENSCGITGIYEPFILNFVKAFFAISVSLFAINLHY